MEVAPVIDRNMSSVLFFPMMGILFLIKNPKVKNNEPKDLKNTI